MTSSEILIYALAAACIILALIFAAKALSAKIVITPQRGESKPGLPKTRIPCVLCGAQLEKGEKLHSKEIVRDSDSLVHMYGCPHCHGVRASRPKTCPVCRKPMGADEYLIGRMWVRKNGKKHLHVAGCMRCARSV